jgi:adenylate kinase
LELRVTGRRSCPKCGTAYHTTFNSPKNEGVCDKDGEKLTQRPDDTPEVVQNRIKTYHDQTAPLISYYQKQDNLKSVDGNVDIEMVTKSLFDVIDAVKS